MCGICGIAAVDLPGTALAPVASAMNAALVHRGPDSRGQATFDFCSIAMTRLAVIDVDNGAQPMTTEDGRYSIVFNGEIYNFGELRESLERSGSRFRTHSDTEVILHLYAREGSAMLPQLKGMFAFCIADAREQTLFLARDRFGEKPLYYARASGRFAYSSELKSLLEWGTLTREINHTALHWFLRHGLVPAPLTMFRAVEQLPPGCSMRWKAGEVEISRYYFPDRRPHERITDPRQAAEMLRPILLQAVKRQMISDVPLGALLSGGLDSSAIVAAMQAQSSAPVKTFTMRFEHAPYDESAMARRVANHLGTDHHEEVISNGGFTPDDLWRVVDHVGEPFADSSAIPMYHICRQIRREVTVCLSGDGGDEMFAGYDYFRWLLKVDRAARALPSATLRVLAASVRTGRHLLHMHPDGLARRLQRGFEVAALPPDKRLWAAGELFTESETQQLLCIGATSLSDPAEPGACAPPERATTLRLLMLHRLRHSLPEDMLVKVDRMSMASSLEVRAPMLDADLSAFAATLDDDLLIRGNLGKVVLRDAIRPWLPPEVFTHPKRGFSIPLHMYRNAAYDSLCRELLIDSPPVGFSALFSPAAVKSCVDRGLSIDPAQAADVSVYRATHQLWALLHVAAWMHRFQVTA